MRRVVLATVIAVVPILTGVVGFYLGSHENRTVASSVDQEASIATTPNALPVGTLRCTYHRSDGTTIVSQSSYLISLTVPSVGGSISVADFNKMRCPPP